MKEHKQNVVHNQIDKSAVPEHVNQYKDYNINFNKVKMLNKELHYEKRIIKEAIKIEKVQQTSIEKTIKNNKI